MQYSLLETRLHELVEFNQYPTASVPMCLGLAVRNGTRFFPTSCKQNLALASIVKRITKKKISNEFVGGSIIQMT
jgi:hypothetical protein